MGPLVAPQEAAQWTPAWPRTAPGAGLEEAHSCGRTERAETRIPAPVPATGPRRAGRLGKAPPVAAVDVFAVVMVIMVLLAIHSTRLPLHSHYMAITWALLGETRPAPPRFTLAGLTNKSVTRNRRPLCASVTGSRFHLSGFPSGPAGATVRPSRLASDSKRDINAPCVFLALLWRLHGRGG